jgi:hypothetical protein
MEYQFVMSANVMSVLIGPIIMLILPLSSMAQIYSVAPKSPQHSSHPPHLPMYLSGHEIHQLLKQKKSNVLSVSDDAFSKILSVGERNIAWLSIININLKTSAELKSEVALRGTPVDSPRTYSRESILREFNELISILPGEMKDVLFHGKSFSKLPVGTAENHLFYARKIESIYRTAGRWMANEPHIETFSRRRFQDVRGYYFLSKKENLSEYLAKYESYSETEKKQIDEWVVGLCLNTFRDFRPCWDLLALHRHELEVMVETFWEHAQYNFNSFFKIPHRVKNENTKLIQRQLISSFQADISLREKNFIKSSIENIWRTLNLQVVITFSDNQSSPPNFIEWIKGSRAHVKGLGSNHIVMDSQSDLSHSTTRYIFTHEFGHVLGFPDCYFEFYDQVKNEFVYYEMDLSNIMCSPRGAVVPEMIDELIRVYGAP